MTKKVGSGSISQRHGSADPDPLQNDMDLEQAQCINQGRIHFICIYLSPHLPQFRPSAGLYISLIFRPFADFRTRGIK